MVLKKQILYEHVLKSPGKKKMTPAMRLEQCVVITMCDRDWENGPKRGKIQNLFFCFIVTTIL
jgi:hypothetical protein